MCSACSVVGFSAGNWGQSLGFANHGKHGNHGKRRLSFPCVRRVLWLDSRLVTGDSPWVLLASNSGQSLGLETLESAGR